MKSLFMATATALLFVVCVGISSAGEESTRLTIGETAPIFDATNVIDGKMRCYI